MISAHTRAIVSPAAQFKAIIVPTPEATDFPPLNCRNTDLLCPRITAIEASTGANPTEAPADTKNLASNTGSAPLKASSKRTIKNQFLPSTLFTFVAPVEPEPIVLMSSPVFCLTTIYPVGIDPIMYAMITVINNSNILINIFYPPLFSISKYLQNVFISFKIVCMEYKFLGNSTDKDIEILPESDKIHPLIIKNNSSDIKKALDFLDSDEKFLYVHGFLGTGKRQVLNYISQFAGSNVIKLEYYCKQSTVCDDILLSFIDIIEKNNLSKAVNTNVKISTLAVKFQQYISSIKKPFLIILHSFDDILEENQKLVKEIFSNSLSNENVKIIISTKAMTQDILGENIKYDRKLFIKAFSKDIFKEFLNLNNIEINDKFLDEFYKFTRGYYYYTALSLKIMAAMELSVSEFIEKIKLSGMNFDTYLGATYINLIPQSIRNFFWFLRSVRHGLTLNALAVWDLYDEFSVSYLKTNLMVFESNETLYVQDYFLQNIDISIPEKVDIKLHKYIISIYEKELKEQLQNRSILISRQAMRAEIKYHNDYIENITNNKPDKIEEPKIQKQTEYQPVDESLESKIKEAENLIEKDKYTDSIEKYLQIIENESLSSGMLNEIRHRVASLYEKIGEYSKSQHYYELVEKYFTCNNELINLNYLYYEFTGLYYAMYKHERAIETIKKVIYSVDTPQSLMVDSCTLLGNIYSDLNNSEEAYSYYQKALESLDDNTDKKTLSELYFKYALANDEKGNTQKAFEYYNKCISLNGENFYAASAYSNLGSCYFENNNLSDAEYCFKKAYDIEKSQNNFDGIYYNSMKLAKIYNTERNSEALNYLKEAQQSAEFINENSYILESTVALGDYYYNIPTCEKNALREYFKAKNLAETMQNIEISKIEKRITDMKLRMNEFDYTEIENKYAK